MNVTGACTWPGIGPPRWEMQIYGTPILTRRHVKAPRKLRKKV